LRRSKRTVIKYKAVRRALNSFLHSYTDSVARVLVIAAEKRHVSYDEIEKVVEDDIKEVLLLGHNWRLTIPARTYKSMEWEDRVLMVEPGEVYEMPNVVQCLVREAGQSGQWEPKKAVSTAFKQIGESKWALMPKLVELLGSQAKGNRISAVQVKQACEQLGIGERVDPLIAELKSTGIMSPCLASLTDALHRRAPVYELNPSLFIK